MPKSASADNNLFCVRPDVAGSWHPTKNGELTPMGVTPKSNIKVWWQCENGHEWSASVASRLTSGCRQCYLQSTRISKFNKLSELVDLVDEVFSSQPNLQEILDTYPGSTRKIQWECGTCKNIWENSIRKRAIEGRGCPYCSKRKIDYAKIYSRDPNLLLEWDKNKNSISPYEAKSVDRIHWKCIHNHEWTTTFSQRVNQQTGCRQCVSKVSRPNLRIYSELKFFLDVDVSLSAKVGKYEVDILVPSHRLVIEYDGFPYHHPEFSANAISRDEKKTQKLLADGFSVIRLRDYRLPKLLSGNSIICNEEELYKCVPVLLHAVHSIGIIDDSYKSHLNSYEKSGYNNDQEYLRSLVYLKKVRPEHSLAATHPHLVSEWSKRNADQPTEVLAGSHEKRWWTCQHGHETFRQIKQRALLNTRCGVCTGRLPSAEKNLREAFPKIADEFDIDANGGQLSEHFTPSSNQKVWWKCASGHTWQAFINNRTKKNGTNCPDCKGKRASKDHNLEVLFRDVASLLDTSIDQPKAADLSPHSGKTVQWRCPSNHVWQYTVDHQVRRGFKCPICKR